MVILTDCFRDKLDEGCIKVANSLAKRLKDKEKSKMISYGNLTSYADEVVKVDKAFLGKNLYKALDKTDGPILFLPFSSNSKGGVVKTYFLAKKSNREVYALFTLRHSMKNWQKKMLKASKANVITLSKDSFDFFRDIVGDKAIYLRTGIDTEKFHPIEASEKNRIREKYGIKPEEKVVLHVGHLKRGRNVEKLLQISDSYKVILVVSSITEKDNCLRESLKDKGVIIIEDYIENINEVYQMADVYFFPVEKEKNSIDVPLSVLEAASCNIPIVCTKYGELKAFEGADGFFFMNTISEEEIAEKLSAAINYNNRDNIREAVLDYDWSKSVETLIKKIGDR